MKRGSALQRLMLVASLALLATAASGQTIEYYHLDAIGSVRAITDAEGGEVARYDYLPFGQEHQAEPSGKRRFAAKELDRETGQHYFEARYHDSRTGRFAAVDPVMDIQRSHVDPQIWNRYAYARTNPLVYVDPDGRKVKLLGTESQKLTLFQEVKNTLEPSEVGAVSLGKDGFINVKDHVDGRSGAFKDLKTLVAHDDTVTLQLSETVTHKSRPGPSQSVSVDLRTGGGGAAVPKEVSLSGLIEVYLDPRGNPSGQPSSVVLAHELFGHALDFLSTGTSSEPSAIRKGNELRSRRGLPPRR